MFGTSRAPIAHETPGLQSPTRIDRAFAASIRHLLYSLRRRSQGFAWFVLGASVATQLLVALVADTDPDMLRTVFVAEVRVLSLVGVLISVAAFVTPGRRSFWSVMVVRLLITGALVGAARNAAVLVHLMVLLPVLMEFPTYEHLTPAIIADSVVTISYVGFLSLYSALDPLYIVLGGSGCGLVCAQTAAVVDSELVGRCPQSE